jgi:hypothetical protein
MSHAATPMPAHSAGLKILQPSNILILLTFYSPILVAVAVLSWGVIMQSVKGFVYLLFMLAMSVLREFAYVASGNTEAPGANAVCNAISFSKHGNNTFSTFMLSFTIVYLCMPMFINASVNWIFVGVCITGFITDMGVRSGVTGCTSSMSAVFLNIVAGLVLAMAIVGTMTANGGEKFLFFNEIQSDSVVCSRPTKQQFKCAVYKNGELLSDNVV